MSGIPSQELERISDGTSIPLLDFEEPRFRVPRKPIPGLDAPPTRNTTTEPETTSYKTTKLEETTVKEKGTTKGAIRVFYYWWFECLSCFLVLAALIAIISLLLPHDGKPTPQWPYQTSINTVVSAFATVLKFSMIIVVAEGLSHRKWGWFETNRSLYGLVKYDSASRGALGSTKLLYALRVRDWISCIGALLTVCALALDPFAQQLIRHYVLFYCGPHPAGNNSTNEYVL
jgi:hypothetical protein